MDGVLQTPLKRITHPKGDVFHAMKASSQGYRGFGEAYFSTIAKGETKGWKQHLRMTLNFVVPIGKIRVYLLSHSEPRQELSLDLSPDPYFRLTVEPGIWVAFEGIGEDTNLLLNLADIEHDPNEAINRPLEDFPLPNP